MLRFGTDGVRGVANLELTPEYALALGRAAARVLASDCFVVGRDTRVHAERYASWVGRSPFPVVPVGASDEFFDVPDDDGARPVGAPLRVLYVGGFLPLHGVDTIFDAADVLHEQGVRDVVIECVGDGIRYAEMRARAQARSLENVVFHGRRPLDGLRLILLPPAPARLEISGAETVTSLPRRRGGAVKLLHFPRPRAVHRMWWTREPVYLYQLGLEIEGESGGATFLLQPVAREAP